MALSTKDLLKKLVELQKIDADIYEFKNQLKEKPILLENLKKDFETSKATLLSFEDKGKAVQLTRKQLETDLQGKESEIAKSNADLSKLKTNKEYTAKLQEIESLKADKSIIEEKILNSFDASDEVNGKIAKEKLVVAEKEKDFAQKKKIVDDEIKVLHDQVKALEEDRTKITPDIDPNNLVRYERILQNKEGMAIVPIQKGVCGGCNINVTQQMINALKMSDQIVMCETCARILYLEEAL